MLFVITVYFLGTFLDPTDFHFQLCHIEILRS